MQLAEYALAAGCVVVAYLLIDRGWTSWRDLALMWLTIFLGITALSAARDGLPWGLAPAFATALFFSLFQRQATRTIPPPERERIRSVPPRNHKLLEIAQLGTAGIAAVVLTIGESSAPVGGYLLMVVAYALVGVETLARISSRNPAEPEMHG